MPVFVPKEILQAEIESVRRLALRHLPVMHDDMRLIFSRVLAQFPTATTVSALYAGLPRRGLDARFSRAAIPTPKRFNDALRLCLATRLLDVGYSQESVAHALRCPHSNAFRGWFRRVAGCAVASRALIDAHGALVAMLTRERGLT